MFPNQDSWTIVFSKNSTSWGSFTYDEKEDALRVTVAPKAAEFRDALTYEFGDPGMDDVALTLRWEKVAVPVKVAVDVPAVTEAALARQLRDLVGYSWQAWDDASRVPARPEISSGDGAEVGGPVDSKTGRNSTTSKRRQES